MVKCKHSREISECEDLSEFKKYEDKIFNKFLRLYENNAITFHGKSVAMKHYPPEYDKRSGFYHMVCENYEDTGNELDRSPNLRRYERITWAEQLINKCSDTSCEELCIWRNIRRGKKNILIYCTSIDYLVVLGVRNNYFLLITAYPIEKGHTRRRLLKEYNNYKANNAL
jgi:hypothetical protein